MNNTTPDIKLKLKVIRNPDINLAVNNNMYVGENNPLLKSPDSPLGRYIEITKDFKNTGIYRIIPISKLSGDTITTSGAQRVWLNIYEGDEVMVNVIDPSIFPNASIIHLKCSPVVKPAADVPIIKVLENEIMDKLKVLVNDVLTMNQRFLLEYKLKYLNFSVTGCETAIVTKKNGDENKTATSGSNLILQKCTRCRVVDITKFIITADNDIDFVNTDGNQVVNIFKPDWKFENMGIGGLDKEFEEIFRRAFSSRLYPPKWIEKMGVQHVKGLLLYGPPGTGKTLIARQIGKILKGKEPKVINGPEILNKYVGQSEENIRNLFADAENEYKSKGSLSQLHVIIFDEIDAVCKQRGSSRDSTGVGDTIVNQLLAKMDGVNSLNNILIIGMTNRKDLIDDALLRPGRFEVHIEISLPDEEGRLQILRIHTKKLFENKAIDLTENNLLYIASKTVNYSGAEILGLVKSAQSFALYEHIDPKTASVENKENDPVTPVITMDHFEKALLEVRPAYGIPEDILKYRGRMFYPNLLNNTTKGLNNVVDLIKQVQDCSFTRMETILFRGDSGTGKTAQAVNIAVESKIPFVKIITPSDFIGYTETAKAYKIHQIFEDAYKSGVSIIILDNLEGILEYVSIGPRFSNTILQAVSALLRKPPPEGKKIIILATALDEFNMIKNMGLNNVFNLKINFKKINDRKTITNIIDHMKDQINIDEQINIIEAIVTPITVKSLVQVLGSASNIAGNSNKINVGNIKESLNMWGIKLEKEEEEENEFE